MAGKGWRKCCACERFHKQGDGEVCPLCDKFVCWHCQYYPSYVCPQCGEHAIHEAVRAADTPSAGHAKKKEGG